MAPTKGLGGYVLTNTPPDAGLEQVLGGTSFELGGYLNLTLIKNWRVTYAFGDGKIYVENGPAEAG